MLGTKQAKAEREVSEEEKAAEKGAGQSYKLEQKCREKHPYQA